MAAELKLVEKESNVDRQKALEAALAQIDRAFGKGSAMKLGQKEAMQVEAVSTGSLGLDIALGVGGLPRGRVIEIYGPESSGKTTLALHCIAEAQKIGGTAAFVDAEHALLDHYPAAGADDFDTNRPVLAGAGSALDRAERAGVEHDPGVMGEAVPRPEGEFQTVPKIKESHGTVFDFRADDSFRR